MSEEDFVTLLVEETQRLLSSCFSCFIIINPELNSQFSCPRVRDISLSQDDLMAAAAPPSC